VEKQWRRGKKEGGVMISGGFGKNDQLAIGKAKLPEREGVKNLSKID